MDESNTLPSISSLKDKVENDPWIPLEESPELNVEEESDRPTTDNYRIGLPLPQNPLYEMIDSQKYIQSLEKKLAKLTKSRKKEKEPTSRDIINSLAIFHEDQMRRYIDDSAGPISANNQAVVDDSSIQPSYLQRKIHPDRQALNLEEIAELVKEDVMAEKFEELSISDPGPNDRAESVQTLSDKLTVISQEKPDGKNFVTKTAEKEQFASSILSSNNSEDWANFDDMNQDNERDT